MVQTGKTSSIEGLKLQGKGFTEYKTDDGKVKITTKKGVELIFDSNAKYQNARIYHVGDELVINGALAADGNSHLSIQGTDKQDKITVIDSDVEYIATGKGDDQVIILGTKVKKIDLGQDNDNNGDTLDIQGSLIEDGHLKSTNIYTYGSKITSTNIDCTNIFAVENSVVDNTSLKNNKIGNFRDTRTQDSKIDSKDLYVENSSISNSEINCDYVELYNVESKQNKYHCKEESDKDCMANFYTTGKTNLNDKAINAGIVVLRDKTQVESGKITTTFLEASDKSTINGAKLEVSDNLSVYNKAEIKNSEIHVDSKKNTEKHGKAKIDESCIIIEHNK